MFSYTKVGNQIRREKTCSTVPHNGNQERVKLSACGSTGGSNEMHWTWKPSTKQIIHDVSGKCFDARDYQSEKAFLQLKDCDGSDYQKWEWEHVLEYPEEKSE